MQNLHSSLLRTTWLFLYICLLKWNTYLFSFIKTSSAGNKILHCILLRKGQIRPKFRQYRHLCILIKKTHTRHTFIEKPIKLPFIFHLLEYIFFSILSFYWKCFELEPALKPTETSMQDWALLCLYNTIHTYCISAISRNLV